MEEWDLYRTFHAVAQSGGFAAAARALGVSQSTISRHVARLEGRAGTPLFERSMPGKTTERGAALLDAVRPMVEVAARADAALETASAIDGEVTITTVGEIVRWVLAPNLAPLYRAHPRLRVTLLASNEVHSLAGGEADVALRMARPARGELVARRLAVASFALFAARSLRVDRDTPWLGVSGTLARVPEHRLAARALGGRAPRLLVPDIDSLATAVAAGLGVAVLPRLYAAQRGDLVEVDPRALGGREVGPFAARALWLVVHRSKRDLPKIRAVVAWLDALFRDDAPRR
ncbi:MAG: LysR family transcriptional regulator [Labilithrix sp.]|nr:LysR family transcriptional regulator [Labilithrix sp.]MCW5816363.1 LysR family transcriptional regulator [Labilithrix sp.]